MSLRSAVALPVGVQDLMDEVARYERSTVLSEKQKAALRLADSCLAYPAGFAPEQQAQVLEHFTAEEILGMLLMLLNAHGNKVNIALGLDQPLYGKEVGEVTLVELNDRGEYVPVGAS
jgi:hypothetical protein